MEGEGEQGEQAWEWDGMEEEETGGKSMGHLGVEAGMEEGIGVEVVVKKQGAWVVEKEG